MIRLFSVLFLLFPAVSYAQDIEIQSVPYGQQGKEAWLVESHEVPIITLKFAFREAGSISDPKGKEGRAKMLASLLNEGAGELKALAFNQELEAHAIQLSFGTDADQLTAEVTTLVEHKDKALELLGLALTKPRLDDDAISRTRAQMLTSLKLMQEQPRYVAARALSKTIYAGHPYGNPTEGTEASLSMLGKPTLKSYLAHYITAANLQISVVGDITAPELKLLLDTHLAGLPAKFQPESIVPEWTWSAKPGIQIIARPIPQTVLVFAGPGIPRNDRDFYAAYVLNHLLGGSTLTSKMGNEIRENRGLAYYASTGLGVQDKAATFTGGFGTRNEQAAAAWQVAKDTLKAVENGEITDAEINEAKGYIIGAWPLSLADNDGLAGMLQVMQRFELGKDYLKERNGLIAAPTREDIIRVAKRLVQSDQLVAVAVGAPEPALDSIVTDNKNPPQPEAQP